MDFMPWEDPTQKRIMGTLSAKLLSDAKQMQLKHAACSQEGREENKVRNSIYQEKKKKKKTANILT